MRTDVKRLEDEVNDLKGKLAEKKERINELVGQLEHAESVIEAAADKLLYYERA